MAIDLLENYDWQRRTDDRMQILFCLQQKLRGRTSINFYQRFTLNKGDLLSQAFYEIISFLK